MSAQYGKVGTIDSECAEIHDCKLVEVPISPACAFQAVPSFLCGAIPSWMRDKISMRVDLSRIKSRSIAHANVVVGEGDEPQSMMHLTLSVLKGRDTETRHSYGKTLFECMKTKVAEKTDRPVSITLEVREMDSETYFK